MYERIMHAWGAYYCFHNSCSTGTNNSNYQFEFMAKPIYQPIEFMAKPIYQPIEFMAKPIYQTIEFMAKLIWI